jgi:hypothetical protein
MSKIVYTWWANLETNAPIILAIIGFGLASIILFPRSCNKELAYHDLLLKNKKELVDTSIKTRITRLNDKLFELNTKFEAAKNADTLKLLNDSIKKTLAKIGVSKIELNDLKYNNADTSLSYFVKYFSADRDEYRAAVEQLQDSGIKKLAVSLKDTTIVLGYSPFILKDSLEIQRVKLGIVPFFDRYPIFGFWFFFSIAQMSLWFFIVALVFGVIKRTDDIVPALKCNFKNISFFSIIPFLTIGFFVWMLYWNIIDSYVIKDSYFLDLYNSKMFWYSVPGYIVATLCFAGYLYLSNKLELLDLDAYSNKKTLVADPNLENQYKKLKSSFDNVFLFNAIILSVFVLWIGILFNSVNSLEAMHFYSLLSGSSFLSYDFVYLIGLLHTLLLLVFYVPVRLRFNSLDIKKQDDAISKAKAPNKYLKILWESLGTLLITTSPIITTILQKIISGFFSAG